MVNSMARKLINLKINEVSLVNLAANKRKFAIIKMKGCKMNDELKELFAAFQGKELTDDEIKEVEKLDKEKLEEIEKSLILLEQYKDDLPDDAVAAIGAIVKVAGGNIPEPKKEEEEDDNPIFTALMEMTADKAIEKAGKKLSKETKAILDKVVKGIEDLSAIAGELKKLMPDKAVGKSDPEDGKEEKTTEDVSKEDEMTEQDLEEIVSNAVDTALAELGIEQSTEE